MKNNKTQRRRWIGDRGCKTVMRNSTKIDLFTIFWKQNNPAAVEQTNPYKNDTTELYSNITLSYISAIYQNQCQSFEI